MIHKILRPFIAKVSVLVYFPLLIMTRVNNSIYDTYISNIT